MKTKKLIIAVLLLGVLFAFAGCGAKKCKNGCGNAADTKCMAEMCDKCCDYWMGLNGCYANH